MNTTDLNEDGKRSYIADFAYRATDVKKIEHSFKIIVEMYNPKDKSNSQSENN